ncbi:MAG: type IV pilin N-terminal domain-containing protein [Methanocorpusculum sp.]|nr:type IV pilin N-terminal domain-containing protein [Methanocorpusculum sp.]
MIRTKSEDAVSPVIGVMLMLVVTIIIAAVVAVFASGVGMDSEPAPATAVDVVGVSAFGPAYEVNWDKMDELDLSDDGAGTIIFSKDGVDVIKLTPTGAFVPLTEDSTLLDTYCVINPTGVYSPSVTITSLHGESLDLSKVSVKVYYHHNYLEDGVLEVPLNSLSGTLSPGDTLKIPLSAEMVDSLYPLQSSTVDVIVYYGSHKIAEAEKLVVS